MFFFQVSRDGAAMQNRAAAQNSLLNKSKKWDEGREQEAELEVAGTDVPKWRDRIRNEFIRGILVLLEVTREVGTGRREAQRKSRGEIYGCGERGHEGEEDAEDMGSRGAVRARACVRACVEGNWGMDTWITCDKPLRNV